MMEIVRLEGVNGDYVRCTNYGLMPISSCALNWIRAPRESRETGRLSKCVGCEFGRRAAGSKPSESPLPFFCTRCRRTGQRLTRGGLICVSCANREQEVKKGANRKGATPRKWARLEGREAIVWQCGTKSGVYQATHALDAAELLLQVCVKNGFKTTIGGFGGVRIENRGIDGCVETHEPCMPSVLRPSA